MNNQKYVLITTAQIRQLIALSQNPTLDFVQVYDKQDGGAEIAFYLNEQSCDAGQEPKESINLKSAKEYKTTQETLKEYFDDACKIKKLTCVQYFTILKLAISKAEGYEMLSCAAEITAYMSRGYHEEVYRQALKIIKALY